MSYPIFRYGCARLACALMFGFGFWSLDVAAEDLLAFDTTPPRLNLHVNGFTWHMQRRGLNEGNWGVGADLIRYRTQSRHPWLANWMVAHEIDVFLDSHRNWGGSCGYSIRRPLTRQVRWGLNGGVIYQRDYQGEFGVPVLPFILPFLETNFRSRLNVRVTYCPPIERSFHVLMVQCIVPLGRE